MEKSKLFLVVGIAAAASTPFTALGQCLLGSGESSASVKDCPVVKTGYIKNLNKNAYTLICTLNSSDQGKNLALKATYQLTMEKDNKQVATNPASVDKFVIEGGGREAFMITSPTFTIDKKDRSGNIYWVLKRTSIDNEGNLSMFPIDTFSCTF